MRRVFILGAAAAATCISALLPGVAARASTFTYVANDDGVSPSGPFTNSDAERSLFLGASGAITHGFGHQTLGASSGTWLNGDGTWTLTLASASCCTASYTGVTKTQTGSATDGFQVYNNGGNSTKWLGIEGVGSSVTFNNTTPTHSFGAYFSGLNGSGHVLEFTFNDGTDQTIYLPSNFNGGVLYWGITDTNAFNNFTITDLSGDNFGIDGISFNSASVSATPLPASLPLLLSGLGGLGLLGLRRKRNATVTA